MVESPLRLVDRKNCFISLPRNFEFHGHAIKDSSSILLCIGGKGDRNEIYVSWDGRYSPDSAYELDFHFATCNKLHKDNVIVVSVENNIKPQLCLYCDVFPLKPGDYSMLESKFGSIEKDLLNKSRIVHENLIIPIWLSTNVQVPVRVTGTQPLGVVALSNRTEFRIIGTSNQNDENGTRQKIPDTDLAFFDSCLGLRGKKEINFGAMLVHGSKGSGKSYYVQNLAYHYAGISSLFQDCRKFHDLRPETVRSQLLSLAKEAIKKQPSILCLEDIELFVSHDAMHDHEKGLEILKGTVLVDSLCNMLKYLERHRTDDEPARVAVVLTTKYFGALNVRLIAPKGGKFIKRIKFIDELDKERRLNVILESLNKSKCSTSHLKAQDLEMIANKTDSFSPLDLKLVSQKAVAMTRVDATVSRLHIELNILLKSLEDHVPINLRAVKLKKKSSRTFANVGGMTSVKATLTRVVLLPFMYPNLMRQATIRLQTHVLLYGPSGCGKTLISEALANEQNLNLICIKGPELFSKYIGGSEAAIRELFERAELAAPCIVLFDEFDSIAPRRGHDSTGVTDRVVNQLLTLLDGARRLKTGVHIVAVTSRPDLIDPALLRPGRLDNHIYCGPPNVEDRFEILNVLSSNIAMEREIDLHNWALKLDRFTGADIHSLLYTAQLKALHQELDKKGDCNKSKKDFDIRVAEAHLEMSFESMKVDVMKRSQAGQFNSAIIGTPAATQISSRATLA